MPTGAIRLATRRILALSGPDTFVFLQSILSADLRSLSSNPCVYSYFLNAKGRIVADLFLYKQPDENDLLVEVDAAQLDHVERLFKLYRLRKRVAIDRVSDDVHFVSNDARGIGDVKASVSDPRLGDEFGKRAIGRIEGAVDDEAAYIRRRIAFGLAEGPDEVADLIPMSVNGDWLKAVSFDKGCYIGQELMARTHHTGVIRKRLMPFSTSSSSTDIIPTPAKVTDAEGRRRGVVVRSLPGIGLGVVSLEAVAKQIPLFTPDKVPLTFAKPAWWPTPVTESSSGGA